MKQVNHTDAQKLQGGEYFRVNPQGLGAQRRKGIIDRAPKPGHERRTSVPGVWVTWFAGDYEFRHYGHGLHSGLPPVDPLHVN